VAAIDLWGHGTASHGAGGHAAEQAPSELVDIAREVSAAVDALQWQEFGVIGYSFGAVIGALVAATNSRVLWSVLGGMGTDTLDLDRSAELARLLDEASRTGESSDGTVSFALSRGRNAAALGSLVRSLPGCLDGMVLDSDRHSLVVGDADSPESAATLATALGGLTLTQIAGDHVSVFLDASFLEAALSIAESRWQVARRPASKHRPVLIVMSGPPGSGKTSVARELAARHGAVVVSSDSVRRELFSQPSYTLAESVAAYDACIAQTVEALHQGSLVVFDATNLRKSPGKPDASRALIEQAWALGAHVVVTRLTAPIDELERRVAARLESVRADDDASEADIAVLRSFDGAQGPRLAIEIDTQEFDPVGVAGLLAPLVHGGVSPLVADAHIALHHSLQRGAQAVARGENEHPDARYWQRVIDGQIARDAADPIMLNRWAMSTMLDAASGSEVVPQAAAERIAALAGVHCAWPVMHAGIAHTYGYLLSGVPTPYGYKRDRWVNEAVASLLAVDARTLGAHPATGTLLSNLTSELDRAVDRVRAGTVTPGTGVVATIIEERVHRADAPVLRTYLIPGDSGVRRAPTDTTLLIYTIEHEARFGVGERLVTAFPVSDDFASSLVESCAEDVEIVGSYNVDSGLPAAARGTRRMMHAGVETH
jgi:predicted kinase